MAISWLTTDLQAVLSQLVYSVDSHLLSANMSECFTTTNDPDYTAPVLLAHAERS